MATRVKPYTTRARVALAIARGSAAARGDATMTPTHVALGLLREGESAAVAALRHAGIDLPALRRELESALGTPPGRMRPDEVAVPLTPGEQLIAQQARAASDQREDEYVGPERLLLAVFKDEQKPAAQVLARHGLDPAAADYHIDAIYHQNT